MGNDPKNSLKVVFFKGCLSSRESGLVSLPVRESEVDSFLQREASLDVEAYSMMKDVSLLFLHNIHSLLSVEGLMSIGLHY